MVKKEQNYVHVVMKSQYLKLFLVFCLVLSSNYKSGNFLLYTFNDLALVPDALLTNKISVVWIHHESSEHGLP